MSDKAKVIIIFTDAKGRFSSDSLQQMRELLGRVQKWWDKLKIEGKTIFYYADRPVSRSYIESLAKKDPCFSSDNGVIVG